MNCNVFRPNVPVPPPHHMGELHHTITTMLQSLAQRHQESFDTLHMDQEVQPRGALAVGRPRASAIWWPQIGLAEGRWSKDG